MISPAHTLSHQIIPLHTILDMQDVMVKELSLVICCGWQLLLECASVLLMLKLQTVYTLD